ncbi:DUF58 domain-containing protein [Crenothrix polyspora]|uniref:Uncharacterized protein n=1 Tax=Crenothrix polyspora TaxID=360316 RepID=A0A1R4H264_9GAMM|nr:DUF58 domain-containing protein [Crenothrix polyspora]SJM90266.1 conserved hypothetical protein [Crenothrix polyspora]
MTLKERFGLDRFLLGERTVDGQPLVLNQRRIFILPTQRGLGFVFLIVILMLIAFVYNNNLAYMLAFLLGSVFFITILHTYKSLAGLTVQPGQSTAVFAGDSAAFKLIIANPTAVERQHLQLSLKTTSSFHLNAHNKAHISLPEHTHTRGWHTIGTVTLSSRYPLGLFRAWSPIRFNTKVLVYPKPVSQHIPFPETGVSQGLQGSFKKGGDEFYGLQDYQAGDPIRQVYWKAYAKGLGLFSKQYGNENTAEIWLDFNHAPGHSLEERLSYVCRWVIDAEQAGLRYGFILPGLRLEPSNGQAHYRQCLEALAVF